MTAVAIEKLDRIIHRFASVEHALSSGALTTRIGERFALADAADSHRALAGRGTTGKLILVP